MTTVKISDFNEPMNSLLHIKSEDDSDEETQPNQFQVREPTSDSSRDTSGKKRYNWDDFNEEDRPPAKKRYCLE